MNDPAYSIVIPVYNSARSLGLLVNRIRTVFEELAESYEIIFVDDGSPNTETIETLDILSSDDDNVQVIQLSRNFGKARAVLCGMHHASGMWVITIDDDLEQAPEDIPKLLEKRDHDVVIGAFSNKVNHSIFTRITSRIKRQFDSKILGLPKGIQMSPLKLFNARVVNDMLKIETTQPFIPALITYATKDIVQVHVNHHPRRHGKSAFNIKRRFRQFSNLIFGNSSLLLRFIAILGISISFLSFVYSLGLIGSYMTHGRPVAGWTSLMLVTLMLGGVIMFSLGVIGEYLIRIIESVEKRPPYLIRKKSK